MNEKEWVNQGNSMWTYQEVLPYLRQNLNNLLIMMKYIENYPDTYLEFYY